MTTTIAGPRVLLRQGERYRARAHVDKPAFLVADSDVLQALEDEGFSDVKVWRTVASLPRDWPSDQRSVSQGVADFTAFVEATWGLEDATRTRPEGLVAMWVHPQPAPTWQSAGSGTVTLPEVTIEEGPGGSGTETLPEIEVTGSRASAPSSRLSSSLIVAAGAVGAAYGYRHAKWSGAVMAGAFAGGVALFLAELVRIKGTTTGGA